jgi:diguanylate cyclase (GGDEF)-like protein
MLNGRDARPAAAQLIWTTVALNVAYGASIFLVHRTHGYDTLWDGWIFTVASVLPALLVAWRAIVDRSRRAACWWISAGITCNLAANLLYTYHDQNQHPIPYPGPADVPYLISYVAFTIGLVLYMRAEHEDRSRAALMDALVVGLAAGAVTVALWFEPVLRQTGSTAQVLVGLAYPLFDVVFVVVVVSGLAYNRYRPTLPSVAFMAGAGVFALGDVVYMTQLANDTYRPGTWLELTWSIGILLFGVAPWLRTRRRAVVAESSVGQAGIPGIGALVSLLVIAFGLTHSVPPLAAWLAVGSVATALIRVVSSLRELRRANEGFRQARTDDLTTLMNRRGFGEQLDRRLEAGDDVVVLIVDLDGFKEVNDTLGHHAGDRLLGIVGLRFGRVLPAGGCIARLGGDEFGVVVDGDRATADDVAHRLIGVLEHPVALEGITVRVGASVGASCAPEHGTERSELLRTADVAMYEAKRAHAGVSIYDPARDPHSRERLQLIDDLRLAIERRAFELHYQPSVDATTGVTVGMEALLRWPHPELGLLFPDDFIPLAETVGLISAITRVVLDEAVAHLATLRAEGHELRLSVNVSACDLVDEALADHVGTVLERHDVAPDLLTVEITETALASDPIRARRTLVALRSAGVRVAIDDFGVGYSSMSQLMELPVDELKIDKSFLVHLDDDVRAQAILSATIELGRSLGLHVVAEGVETRAALETVARRGVETVQGYFFSRPLPPTEFRNWARTHDVGRTRRPTIEAVPD